MMHRKPDYKSYDDSVPCDACGAIGFVWHDKYTTICDACGKHWTDEDALNADYADIQKEKDYIWNESGGNDKPLTDDD